MFTSDYAPYYAQLRKELDQQQIMVSKFIGIVIFVIWFRWISESIDLLLVYWKIKLNFKFLQLFSVAW